MSTTGTSPSESSSQAAGVLISTLADDASILRKRLDTALAHALDGSVPQSLGRANPSGAAQAENRDAATFGRNPAPDQRYELPETAQHGRTTGHGQ